MLNQGPCCLKPCYLGTPCTSISLSLYVPKYAILQKLNGDKIDVAEQITCYQIAQTPSVIQMDHLVPNKLVHAVLNTVIVEDLQLIVNVPTALTIEQVRLFKVSYVPEKVLKIKNNLPSSQPVFLSGFYNFSPSFS